MGNDTVSSLSGLSKEKTHLFASDIVMGELDLSHRARAEGLCERVVAKDAIRGARLRDIRSMSRTCAVAIAVGRALTLTLAVVLLSVGPARPVAIAGCGLRGRGVVERLWGHGRRTSTLRVRGWGARGRGRKRVRTNGRGQLWTVLLLKLLKLLLLLLIMTREAGLAVEGSGGKDVGVGSDDGGLLDGKVKLVATDDAAVRGSDRPRLDLRCVFVRIVRGCVVDHKMATIVVAVVVVVRGPLVDITGWNGKQLGVELGELCASALDPNKVPPQPPFARL